MEPDQGGMSYRRAILLGLAGHLPENPDSAQWAESAQAFRGRSSEHRLQELIDREEIRELIARYAHRVTEGESVADMFTDDGVFIVRFPGRPVMETRGRLALDALYGPGWHSPARPLPMIHNHLIRIDGDRAIGICSNELRMTEAGESMIGSGSYEDQFRRENGQWKFVVRDMTFMHWVPIQRGWAQTTR